MPIRSSFEPYWHYPSFSIPCSWQARASRTRRRPLRHPAPPNTHRDIAHAAHLDDRHAHVRGEVGSLACGPGWIRISRCEAIAPAIAMRRFVRTEATSDVRRCLVSESRSVHNPSESVVLLANLKVALRICTDRTNLGRFFTHDEMAADAAFPHGFLALFEYALHFDVL